METTTKRTTLLDLVRAVQDNCRSDAEVIAVITHMVKTRRVVLRGSLGAEHSGVSAVSRPSVA